MKLELNYQFWKFNFDFIIFHSGRCPTDTLPLFWSKSSRIFLYMFLKEITHLLFCKKESIKWSFIFIFTVPGSPEFLKITTKSYNSVIISWLPPVKNFVPITGYILYIRQVNYRF